MHCSVLAARCPAAHPCQRIDERQNLHLGPLEPVVREAWYPVGPQQRERLHVRLRRSPVLLRGPWRRSHGSRNQPAPNWRSAPPSQGAALSRAVAAAPPAAELATARILAPPSRSWQALSLTWLRARVRLASPTHLGLNAVAWCFRRRAPPRGGSGSSRHAGRSLTGPQLPSIRVQVAAQSMIPAPQAPLSHAWADNPHYAPSSHRPTAKRRSRSPGGQHCPWSSAGECAEPCALGCCAARHTPAQRLGLSAEHPEQRLSSPGMAASSSYVPRAKRDEWLV